MQYKTSFFVRSGKVNYYYITPSLQLTPISDAGQYGLYWSSTPYASGGLTYYLYFSASGVNPSSYGNPNGPQNRTFTGFPLRCLAS